MLLFLVPIVSIGQGKCFFFQYIPILGDDTGGYLTMLLNAELQECEKVHVK